MAESGAVVAERLDRAVERVRQHTLGRAPTGRSHDDADEDAGTIDTDDAIGFDPRPLLETLWRHGADVVVMGQVAGIMHGSVELTGDLDLLWDGSEAGAERLASAFASADATLANQDGQPLDCGPGAFLLPKVYFDSPTASGDCCTPKLSWGTVNIDAVIERAVSVTLPNDLVIRYVAAPDLIMMRRAVGRPKDLRRANELEQLLS